MARGLTQELLAADSSVAAPYISRIEKGSVNPTVDVLDRLAVALNVAVDELLKAPDQNIGTPVPMTAGRKPKAIT